jgi:hypothetical protein
MSAETDRNEEYLFWSHVPYRVDVTDFSYIHLFFILRNRMLFDKMVRTEGGII